MRIPTWSEDEGRESLAFRLEKARKDRTFEAGQHALSQIIEEEERKLQEYDRQDVKNYRARLLEDRRRSMQYRNEIEVGLLLVVHDTFMLRYLYDYRSLLIYTHDIL